MEQMTDILHVDEDDTGDHDVDTYESKTTNFGRIADTNRPIESNIMVKIDGKVFRCDCGCNVFHKPAYEMYIYECNACAAWYKGVSKR